MDVLPSAEFRKTYAKLTKPTKVTVNGHTIGVWTPGGENPNFDDMPDVVDTAFARFNSRPFTPVPKVKR